MFALFYGKKPIEFALFFFSPTPLVVSVEHTDGQEETSAQQQARMSASSATRELDELMASLSDFKVQSNVSHFSQVGRLDDVQYVQSWLCANAILNWLLKGQGSE